MNEGFTLVLDWQQAETVSKLPLGTKQKLAAGLAPKGGDSRGIKHPVEVEGLVSIEIGTETVTVFAATVLPGSTSALPNGLVVGDQLVCTQRFQPHLVTATVSSDARKRPAKAD